MNEHDVSCPEGQLPLSLLEPLGWAGAFMIQLPSCSIFLLCPLVLGFGSSHLLNFRSDVLKAKCSTWELASINCCDPNHLQSSHSGNWYPRWCTNRPRELNKRYYYCHTTQVWTTKGMGIQYNKTVTETCTRPNTRAETRGADVVCT